MVNETCAVCENLFNKSDDISETRCGHIFHSACLRNFLKRFEKCPECENYATIADIHKVNYDSFGLKEENIEEFQGTQIMDYLGFANPPSRSLCSTSGTRKIETPRTHSSYDYPRYRSEESMYGRFGGNIYNNGGTVIVCKQYQSTKMNSFQISQGVSPPIIQGQMSNDVPRLTAEGQQSLLSRGASWVKNFFF